MRKALNPWDDPKLERLQLVRFNILRNVWMRDAYMRRVYWSTLGFDAEVCAEAEHDAYESLYRDVFAIECIYLRDTYLVRDMESFMNRKDDQPIPTHLPDPDLWPDAIETEKMLRYDALSGLLPITAPQRIEFNVEHAAGRVPIGSRRRSHTAKQQARLHRWAVRFGPLSHAIQSSFDTLLHELSGHAGDSNSLTGAAAKQRALFVNGDVPIPNEKTFLGWWSMSGIAFTELTNLEKDTCGFAGFRPTHMLTYSLPMLPMTREHRAGHQLLGDDSHGDHSISGRSASHHRDSHDRIYHGIWECTTLLVAAPVDPEGPVRTYVVANERVKSAGRAALSIAANHAHMLPRVLSAMERWNHANPKYNPDVFMPGATTHQMFDLTGVTFDPYLVFPHNRPFHWPLTGAEFDEPYRSLAKFHRVHFRFDDDEIGQLAATEWRAAFVQCAVSYLSRTGIEEIRIQLDSAVDKQRPRTTVARGKAGATTAFDLSNLRL